MIEQGLIRKSKSPHRSADMNVLQLVQRNEKKDEKLKTTIYRNYECFKARILDLPWRQTLRPVLDQFKEFEQMVSQKICLEFPAILYKLQQKIVQIAFQEINYKGVTDIQRMNDEGEDTPILQLQINLKTKDMSEEQIITFYHNGMIDYLEFCLNSST